MIEVKLPAAVATAPQPEAVKPSPRLHEGAVSGRVLLVEEEEAVLEFERDVLTGAGASVVTAKNAEDVKTRLLSEPFDAVIMSGKMADQWNAKESYPWLKENCPGMEDSRSLHVLQQRRTRRRTHLPAGKQHSLPCETLRSGRTDQPGAQAAAEGTGGRSGRGLAAVSEFPASD